MTSFNRLRLVAALAGLVLCSACGSVTDAVVPIDNPGPGGNGAPSAIDPAIVVPPAESYVDRSTSGDSLSTRWVKNCYQPLPSLNNACSVYQNASLVNWANQIHQRVNQTRAGRSVKQLTRLAHLDALAQAQARDMALRNYFGHVNPEGMPILTRMQAINPPQFNILGENSAKGQETVEEVVSQWVASPGHYQHMINGTYQYTGIGVYYDPTDAKMPIHVVQVFAELWEDPASHTDWIEPGVAR